MRKRILTLVLSITMIFGCFGTFSVSVSAADQTMSFDTAYAMMTKLSDYLLTITEPTDRDMLYQWVHSYMGTDAGVETLIKLATGEISVDGLTGVSDANKGKISSFIGALASSEEEKNNLRFALEFVKSIPADARKKAFDDMFARKEFAPAEGISLEQQAAIDAVYDEFIPDSYKDMFDHSHHLVTKMVIMQFLADYNQTFVITDDIDVPADFELYYLKSEFKTKLESGFKSKYPTVNGADWQTAEELIASFVDSANTSSKFDNTKKANFKTVLGIKGVDMYVQREFDVTVNGILEQVEGQTTDIVFAANSNITTDNLDDVKWYVDGVLKGTGKTFTYNPTDLTAGEDAVVKAVLGAYSEENTVKVVAAPTFTLGITSVGSLSQISGSTSEVTFTAATDPAGKDLSDATWYVNGILQSDKGETFKYTPSTTGNYNVYCVLDGAKSNTITISVTLGGGGGGGFRPPKEEKEDPTDISNPIKAPTDTDITDQFEDIEGHWAEPYMEALYEAGILKGTSDTTMSPDWGITRQEVAVVMVRILGFENEPYTGSVVYIDEEEIADWASAEVDILSEKEIYVGYGDKSFQPERIISRQEFVSVIGRQLSGNYDIELPYPDADEIYFWAVDHVKELTAMGIVQGFDDKTFRPEDFITRAQAAVILYNTMYRLGVFRMQL